MKLSRHFYRVKILVIMYLIILLFELFVLCSCSLTIGKTEELTNKELEAAETPTNADPVLPISSEPTNTEQPAWRTCTVRVIYWLLGSEIYVLDADGTYSIYTTPEICDSLSSFYDGSCPTELRMSGVLSKSEYAELQTILPSIYTKGKMSPVGEPYESMYAFDCRLDVYISVDNSEEAYVLKNYTNWEGYPQKEYDDLIEFLKSLDPDSIILNR